MHQLLQLPGDFWDPSQSSVHPVLNTQEPLDQAIYYNFSFGPSPVRRCPFRTLFLMERPTCLDMFASIHTLLSGSLLLLESLDKRELISLDRDRAPPPEDTIALFGQKLF